MNFPFNLQIIFLFKKVGILKQEVKRLDLLLKENDSMFHEKEHIKTNLMKFLENAGGMFLFYF